MSSMKIPECPFPNPYNHKIIWTPFTGHIDTDIIGHIILNEDKTFFKIMLFKMFCGDTGYYRGQNENFTSFKTSYQKLDSDLDRCLGLIQKQIFIDWFLRTPYFDYFANRYEFAEKADIPEGQGAKFCFDFEAIAQHYGFPTNYLDITTKKDISEFFAYCYWDKKTGEYKPREIFTDEHKPFLFESKYNSVLNHPFNKDIKIIGFQPLYRPILQFAMGIDLGQTTVDYNEEFYKIELPCDKKRAFAVFDKFEGGKKIFPDDYASIAASMIKSRVKKERIISINSFEKYCEKYNVNRKETEILLKENGYKFSDEELKISDNVKIDMQKEIEEKLIPWIDEFVEYRPIVRGKAVRR